jgi:alkanesulfonate monooxygenase SsuD/methylene tetrahydromethanopterin reductase-like flavin-dependent oxidoreductase (luciferase family)
VRVTRAFGIAAMNDEAAVARIATTVEHLGYSTFWTNDTPAADGVVVAAQAQEATSSIRIAIGVVAIDRRPPRELAKSLDRLDPRRVVVGIGAGFSDRPIASVVRAVKELRNLLPDFKIALAAMGPQMCRAAGRLADVVLLNWMTPERITWARKRIKEGEASRPKDTQPVEVASYIRASVASNDGGLIAEEAARYMAMPHYQRHFEAMGADLTSLGVVLDGDGSGLTPYEEVLDESVVRALPRSASDIDGILRIAEAASN